MRRLAPPAFLICAFAFAISTLAASSCGEKRACYEGDFQACACADGQSGFAACDAAKEVYGECAYCGTVPGSAVAVGSGGASGSGGSGGVAGGTTTTTKVPFMETCTVNEDCESGLCHVYNAKGSKCTQPCQTDSQCPAPSPGCNNMGLCKAP